MFEGSIGKKMMIEQWYVPATCTLDEQLAGPLIYAEVSAGRDPCAGCTADRSKCGGRPPRLSSMARHSVSDILDSRQMRQMEQYEDDARRARESLGIHEPSDVIGTDEQIDAVQYGLFRTRKDPK